MDDVEQRGFRADPAAAAAERGSRGGGGGGGGASLNTINGTTRPSMMQISGSKVSLVIVVITASDGVDGRRDERKSCRGRRRKDLIG